MTAPATVEHLERAEGLRPLIEAHAADSERSRQLAAPTVAALTEAGCFNMLVPRSLGGGELDVASMVQVIEAVSKADGAAGWCVMIAATTGVTAAQLPEAGAREIFGSNQPTGGVLMPRGRATATDGGYRVSGQWAFGSGSGHAKWMLGGSLVFGADGPEMLKEGVPHARMMFFPIEDVGIHDTWDVSGLRGTGSNDFEVRDVFVPASRSCPIGEGKRWADGPLYAFPIYGLLALGIAGVALGIGRAAIEALAELANAKTPTGSRRLLAERAAAQSGIAEAEALVLSSRAFVLDRVRQTWERVSSGEKMSLEDRAMLRLAATSASLNCARAVDICYNLGGGSSIYAASKLQRQFRDIHTLTQHVMVGQPTLEVAGRVMLGLPTDTTMF